MRARRQLRLALAALLAALACAHPPRKHNLLVRDVPDWRIAELGFLGFDPPAGSEARQGMELMLAGGDFRFGLPERYYTDVMGVGGYTPEQMWLFGHLPSPPGRDTHGLPYLAVGHSLYPYAGGMELGFNCLTCHAGAAAGQVVAGLPNTNFDAFTLLTMSRAMVASYDNPVSRKAMARYHGEAAMRSIQGTVEYARSLVLPSFESFPVRGDNPGAYVLWRINARLKEPGRSLAMASPEETTELERQLFGPGFAFPPIEPMPWWNMKYRRRAYWTQDGDNQSPVTFALNLMDHHPDNADDLEQKLERTVHYLAFARATVAPAFPERARVDAALAAQGRALFEGRCARCHGHYADDGALESYPELPNQNVGTDPAYWRTLQSFKPLYDRTDQVYERFKGTRYYPADGEHAIRYPEKSGYVAPPLVGIWASGPYFHNGSVPTVAAVLDSHARPEIWMKSLDPRAYDGQALGVTVEHTFTSEEYAAQRAKTEGTRHLNTDAQLEFRRIYDTRAYGRSNAGHTFGDAFSPEERRAVLEFLKLL